MIGLTRRQAALLRFIQGYHEATGGVSPSLREMRNGLSLGTSKTPVFQLLNGLEERGYIRRLRRRVRAIEVLESVAIPRSPEGEPLYAVPGVVR